MAERPLLFLDVDGVLNCTGRKQDGYDHHKLEGLPVWVPPGTADRLARVVEVYEPIWATAWQGTAHRCWQSVLNLPERSWPWVSYADLKLREILRLAGERRWAWVDDDAEWELSRLGWTRDMVSGLLIVPDHETGLTDEHIEALLAWADSEETPDD